MWDSLIIKPFINTLLLIYNLTGENFGIAIIVFTILVKLITHPLIARQIKSSAALQDLQKDEEYLEMQKKYKNDKERLAQAQMDLYKKKGIKHSPPACPPSSIPDHYRSIPKHHSDHGNGTAAGVQPGIQDRNGNGKFLFLHSRRKESLYLNSVE